MVVKVQKSGKVLQIKHVESACPFSDSQKKNIES